MGIFSYLGLKPRPDYLASPFTEGELTKIVWSDVFGADYLPITRADALGIPALSKARDLLGDAVAKLPLVAVRGATVLPHELQPRWLYWTGGAVSPYLRMLWTVDDLLFYGASVWEVVRGSDGWILSADRVPFDQWKINPLGEVCNLDDQPYRPDQLIYFPNHTAGLLDRGGSALRSAISVGKAVEFRARTPIPVMEISVTDEAEATQAELIELRNGYNKARLDPDGVTVVTPRGVELKGHGDRADAGFMVEGRNSARLDIANLTGVPGSLLEASTSTASLTYSTAEGKRGEFYDFSVSPLINTITGRLSQDDCLPGGQRVEVNMTEITTPVPAIANNRMD